MALRYLILGEDARLTTSQGDEFWVDTADVERVVGYAWQTDRTGPNVYVARRWREGTVIKSQKLHRLLLCPPPDRVVDHIDGDGRNNRRSNLRVCTQAENHANLNPAFRSSTGFAGVYRRGEGRFVARIRRDGRLVTLGTFEDAEDASRAYRAARGVADEFYNRSRPAPLSSFWERS
jgi:hypothetical protein